MHHERAFSLRVHRCRAVRRARRRVGGWLELHRYAGRQSELLWQGARVERAHASVRARSRRRTRRQHLHRGDAREQDRALRPADPDLQGMGPTQRRASARAAGGRRRHRLVHGQRQRHHRASGSQDRQGHRAQGALWRRPAHGGERRQRHALVHGAGRWARGSARHRHRQDHRVQVERQPLRHRARRPRQRVVLPHGRKQARQARSGHWTDERVRHRRRQRTAADGHGTGRNAMGHALWQRQAAALRSGRRRRRFANTNCPRVRAADPTR